MAEGFSRATVVAQVMCGFELIELQRRMCLERGAKKGEFGMKPNDSVSWPNLVKEKIGRSDDTARNWMNMARAVQPKLRKLDGPWEAPSLLALPPSEWPEEARASLETTLKGICEGHSQTEFMRELGLAKKPSGNGGGYQSSPSRDTRTPRERAEDAAQDLFLPLDELLFRVASEGEKQKLYLLPITSSAPGKVAGLSELIARARGFLRLAELVIEEKKKVILNAR